MLHYAVSKITSFALAHSERIYYTLREFTPVNLVVLRVERVLHLYACFAYEGCCTFAQILKLQNSFLHLNSFVLLAFNLLLSTYYCNEAHCKFDCTADLSRCETFDFHRSFFTISKFPIVKSKTEKNSMHMA